MSDIIASILPRVVILTMLRVEYQAVRAHLTDLHEEVSGGTVYERGKFSSKGQAWDIAIVEAGSGNIRTATETANAINYFKPHLVIYIGLAGGLREVKLGDVVAATKVYGYEPGKVPNSFLPLPDLEEVPHHIIQRAQAEARKDVWLQRLNDASDRSFRVFTTPIISGETIVRSTRERAYKFIRRNYRDANAVEIGAYGVLKATQSMHVDVFIVSGISGLIDNDKARAYASNMLEIAVDNASAFAFEVLAKMNPSEFQQRKQQLENQDDSLDVLQGSSRSSPRLPLQQTNEIPNTDLEATTTLPSSVKLVPSISPDRSIKIGALDAFNPRIAKRDSSSIDEKAKGIEVSKERNSLMKQLSIKNDNRRYLEEQASRYGGAIPLSLHNEIEDAKKQIADLEVRLAGLPE